MRRALYTQTDQRTHTSVWNFNAWFDRFRESAGDFYQQLARMKSATSSAHQFEMLIKLKTRNEESHNALHSAIHKEVALDSLTDVQVSTLLNVNRELYLSNQSLLAALADALLDTQSATDFDSIPVGS